MSDERQSAGGSVMPEAVERALRARLGIPEGTPIDASRALELVGPLLELAVSMDQLVWRAWSQRVAPESEVKRQELLQRSAAAYLSGAPGPGDPAALEAFTRDAERLRQLTLCLLSAIGQSGTLFAQRWLEKYSVEAIERAAQSEKKLIEAFGATCWRKFGELTAGMDKSAVEAEISSGLSGFVEQVMKGGR